MKISFVLPELSLAGGIRVIAIFALRLQARGHTVHVYHGLKPRPSIRMTLRSLFKSRAALGNSDLPSHFDASEIPMTRIRPSHQLKNNTVPDADVIVATWWQTAGPVAVLARSKGAKVFFMQDYGAPGQEFEKIKPTWLLPMRFITIARWLMDEITQHNPNARVTLVSNSVDNEFFHFVSRGKQKHPTFGFIYRQMYSKGSDIALEAIEIAQIKIPDLKVVIVGSDPPPPNLPENFTYLRSISDKLLRSVYMGCDAWIFPSRSEGYGLPITEAMACGTPVIGTRAGAAAELLPGTGILLQTYEPVEMSNAIEAIAAMTDQEWRALSQAARAKVENYTWDDATERFEQGLFDAIADAAVYGEDEPASAPTGERIVPNGSV